MTTTMTAAGSIDAIGRGLAPAAETALVAEPFLASPGSWAGAPTALLHEGVFWLAYRLRRPVGQGRGYANVIARSDDGVRFEQVALIHKETFGGESLERPTLLVDDDGTWRLYVSVATPGTKHWRVDLVEAAEARGLAGAPGRTVLPGGPEQAVKDPVIVRSGGTWHLWASCHPLDDPLATDRMTTEYATSHDGVEWSWQGTALAGRPGSWDQRGVRVSTVLLDGPNPIALYDGRANADENWEEKTGAAVVEEPGRLRALGDGPIAWSPNGLGGLRYVSALPLPEGGTRFYYEITRADGAHELRTSLVRAAA
jgi:hypothetical protein